MYRNMINKILGGVILSLVLCFTACEDEQLFGRDGNTTIRISATAKFSGAESRAVLATEYKATENNVFMLYKGTDENATLEVMESMTSLEGTIENVLIEGGATYTAVMIANVPKSELESQGVVVGSKLEVLYSATYAVNTTDNKPTDAAAFTWSGVVCGITTANVRNGLNFELNPNVAKVTVNITNNVVNNTEFPANQVELVNVQVRNVANKVRFAQNALSKAGLFTSANNGIDSDGDVLDYEIEELNLAPRQSQTFSWYVPCNMLEPASNSGSRAQKAPNYATYIEIDGIRRLDYMDTAYKVYLGTSTGTGVDYESVGNYYVKADYQYTINATISDDGLNYTLSNNVSDKNDATEPQKVVYPAGSNCYMVHPKISKTATGTIYEVPIDQVNRFWGMKEWFTGEANEISATDGWKATFIWQDIPGKQVIYFCDEKGKDITKSRPNPSNGDLTEYYADGVGHEPIRFKLKDTETYGNVVIGIRKNGVSDYVWSWHLWITDYNPDAAPTPKQALNLYNDKFTNAMYVEQSTTFEIDQQGFYYIDGGTVAEPTYNRHENYGNVQHFAHIYNAYWTSGKGSYDIWNWNAGGSYANKWIMDRNLGAQAPGNSDIKNAWDAFGLYYQFGRKDPFPYVDYDTSEDEMVRKIYDFNGSEISAWTATSGGSFYKGVQKPTIFYTGPSTTWASDYNIVSSDYWYGLESGKHKSIFDPCPPGWCMPMADAFEFATYSPQPVGVYIKTSSYTSQLATFAVYVHPRGWANTSNPDYHRNMGVITSLSTYGSSATRKHLDTVLPSQGYINDSGSNIDGFIVTDRMSLRGCYWCAERSATNPDRGKMLQFQPVTYTKGVTSYIYNSNDTSNGNVFGYTITDTYYERYPNNGEDAGILYYHRMNAPLQYKEFAGSRGQPVRCIQEPNN